MKYVDHFENQELSFNNISKVWRGIIIQSVFFIGLFIFLNQINYFTKTYPQYGVYTFFIGLMTILPSVFVLLKYFGLKKLIVKNFRNINKRFILLGPEARKMQTWLTAGFVLADLTLLSGVAHLVVTGNLFESIYLWASALLLCILYKPCVKYINCTSNPASNKKIKIKDTETV